MQAVLASSNNVYIQNCENPKKGSKFLTFDTMKNIRLVFENLLLKNYIATNFEITVQSNNVQAFLRICRF